MYCPLTLSHNHAHFLLFLIIIHANAIISNTYIQNFKIKIVIFAISKIKKCIYFVGADHVMRRMEVISQLKPAWSLPARTFVRGHPLSVIITLSHLHRLRYARPPRSEPPTEEKSRNIIIFNFTMLVTMSSIIFKTIHSICVIYLSDNVNFESRTRLYRSF